MPKHSEQYDEEKREQYIDHKRSENIRIFNVRVHAREIILVEARRRLYNWYGRRLIWVSRDLGGRYGGPGTLGWVQNYLMGSTDRLCHIQWV